MSKGTSDSSSRGRGKLPGQAGAGHSQTTERGGQCSAGAGQENHQAASASAACWVNMFGEKKEKECQVFCFFFPTVLTN